MIYLFKGGGYVTADSPDQFADRMRSSSRTPSANTADFMEQVSERAWLWNQASVRFDTTDNFLEDLIRHDFVTVIK
jgi:hypothetical protein